MGRRSLAIGAVAAFAVLETAAVAAVSLPAIIGDGMVLQQESDVPVWGWASPGERVRVTPSWDTAPAEAVADERGRWRTSVTTPAAGGPFTLTIAGTNTVTLGDVLVGEVWLCSGQSNMEWPLRATDDAESAIAAAGSPAMRLFTVPNRHAAMPRGDTRGEWVACTPATARDFSAVGYHFGREIAGRLDVPVGLISADWGGTVAQAWMSAGALRDFGGFDDELDLLAALADPNERLRYVEDRVEGWWRRLDGDGLEGWTTAAFDDAGWKRMDLPATWSGALGAFDGIVHFRRVIELDPGWAGAAAILELGPIDDHDDVWVNDLHVGAVHEPNRWNQPRRYEVPAGTLVEGENVIAVRVLDTGGPGGINGRPDQLRLVREGAAPVALGGAWAWRRGVAAAALPPRPRDAGVSHNAPSALYNGLIAPIAPYAIRGVLWYQGESNRFDALRYRTLFPALIADWRRTWAEHELPFYFVQIAPFNYRNDTGQTALVREAQLRALDVPRTGMIVTTDIGDRHDIHPRNKRDVGHRLALLARAGAYGERDLVASGPVFRSMRVTGSTARLAFDHAGSGLELRDNRRGRFLIAGADRQFVVAGARVEGDTLVLSSPHVERPVAIRYGWSPIAEASLFNREGLPASPFRTDDWNGPLPPATNDDEMARLRTTEAGFKDLFNGRDLAGWHNVNGAPSTWRAGGGVIRCSGVPTGVLRTADQHENFILELEWRHLEPSGNAGVFVWSDPLPVTGKPFTRSIEVQVMDGQEADWYTSEGDIFPIQGASMTPENGRGGSRAFPTEARTNPAPFWNHYRLECRDGAIALAVNGKVVTRGRDCAPRAGCVCLESEGTPVEFRNIRIKPLPPASPPIGAELRAQAARGFRTLYNGVDLDGWTVTPEHAGHWRPADWRLEFDGRGPDLWTAESFGDFELICDWRWTGPPRDTERPVILASGAYETDADGQTVTAVVPDAGDSGIYLRGNSKSQVNIWCWPVGSGEVYGYRTDPAMPGDVRAGVTPSAAADAPIGEWNRFRITMEGDLLTVVLNGRTVIDGARLPGVAERGPIGLQSHGSPIEFANIYIREVR